MAGIPAAATGIWRRPGASNVSETAYANDFEIFGATTINVFLPWKAAGGLVRGTGSMVLVKVVPIILVVELAFDAHAAMWVIDKTYLEIQYWQLERVSVVWH